MESEKKDDVNEGIIGNDESPGDVWFGMWENRLLCI